MVMVHVPFTVVAVPAATIVFAHGICRAHDVALKETLMIRVAGVVVGIVFLVPFAAGAQGTAGPGQKVFETQKCSLCHSVAGKGNAKGSLDGVGKKYSTADLKLWITQPAEMAKKHAATRKPPMKSFATLPPADVDALVAYLQSLAK
jgi:mono/diheme cytochrome c family protein